MDQLTSPSPPKSDPTSRPRHKSGCPNDGGGGGFAVDAGDEEDRTPSPPRRPRSFQQKVAFFEGRRNLGKDKDNEKKNVVNGSTRDGSKLKCGTETERT